MPATEETYRRQPTLHLVFAISSIAMLLSTVWMVMADHFRPWKQVQREFQQVEREKLEAAEKEKLEEQKKKYQTQIDEIDAKIKAAEAGAETRGRELRKIDNELNMLEGTAEDARHAAAVQEGRARQQAQPLRRHDRPRRGTRGAGLPDHRRRRGREELDDLSKELEKAEGELNGEEGREGEAPGPRRRPQEGAGAADPRGRPGRARDQAEGRALRRSRHWYSKPMAFLRSLPGIDLMPPTKIQQISLPELTINYNFKEVPRYDRCTTCHQGIDRIGYDKDADGKTMPAVFRVAPVPDRRRHDDRSQGEGRHGRALPRRQRPAPDQQLRLHDLPRRPGLGHRFHLRLAHAQHAQAGGGVARRSTAGTRSTSGTTRCSPSGSSSRAA